MATKNGLYSDRVKDILGDGKVSKYKAEQTNQDIALTRDSVETLEEKTIIYQREMLKTALKQEDYLKKIAKNTHHSLFDRIGKLAENIGNIKHTFDSFRGNDAKRFGAQGLSGMCCCDGQGRRGRMGRTRRGGVSGGGSSTVADNIDDARVRGSGAGQGSGGSPRSRRRNARSTGYQTIRNSAMLLQSKQMVKDWSKATSDVMSGVFKSNTKELQRSAVSISRTTAREAARFTRNSAASATGITAAITGLASKGGRAALSIARVGKVVPVIGTVLTAALAALDFKEGRKQAEELVGRKLSNFEKTKAGGYYAVDSALFGLPSMLTESISGDNFTKYMSQQTPTMMENVQDLFGIGAKYRGITPDPVNQQLGVSERISRSFVDSYKSDPTKIQQELIQGSLGSNLIPQSLRETINDVKQINREMIVNQPVVDGVHSVQDEIKRQTKSIISNDSSNAKKSFTNDKDILNAIKKWAGYPTEPEAREPFDAPKGDKSIPNPWVSHPEILANPRTGRTDYQNTTDSLVENAQRQSGLLSATSLTGGEWKNGGIQGDILPGGFTGSAGTPKIRLSTTGTAVGALGGGGQRNITSQLIDDMLSHPSKPSPLLAKAIVGNMGVESAGTFDPNIKGDGGKALGLMQWHPDRQAKLEAYAKANKLNPRDRRTQALFAVEETVPDSPYADSGRRSSVAARKLIDSGQYDLSQSTGIFGDLAERPKNLSASLKDRQDWAAKADKDYTPRGVAKSFAALASSLDGRGITPLKLEGFGATTDVSSVISQKQGRLAGTRKGDIDAKLSENIGKTVLKVLGEGYRADVFSGGQRMPGAEGAVGSRRHDKGGAGDLRIFDKNGNEISQENYARVVQSYIAEGYGSAGLQMSGGGIHLDNITKDKLLANESLLWNYNGKKNGKHVSKANLDIAKQGLDGVKPDYKMTDEQVARYMAGSDGITPRIVTTSRELPRGDGRGMSALVNKNKSDYVDSRINSAFATSSVDSYRASVTKPDISAAFDIPNAPSWSGSMGNETQANMVMAAPSVQQTVPALNGIPNNADISDLLPLLYAEAVVK